MSEVQLELKSRHLWAMAERVQVDRPNEDADGPDNNFRTPNWVLRAILDDLKMLDADRANVRIAIKHKDAKIDALRRELRDTLSEIIGDRMLRGSDTDKPRDRLRELDALCNGGDDE